MTPFGICFLVACGLGMACIVLASVLITVLVEVRRREKEWREKCRKT